MIAVHEVVEVFDELNLTNFPEAIIFIPVEILGKIREGLVVIVGIIIPGVYVLTDKPPIGNYDYLIILVQVLGLKVILIISVGTHFHLKDGVHPIKDQQR